MKYVGKFVDLAAFGGDVVGTDVKLCDYVSKDAVARISMKSWATLDGGVRYEVGLSLKNGDGARVRFDSEERAKALVAELLGFCGDGR